MISVLIPVFNRDVSKLIYDLHKQLEILKIKYEIIVVDDKSAVEYHKINLNCTNFNNVCYHRLEKNLGRAKIRNYLASLARYDYLLFLDCDVEIVRDDFIGKYLEECENELVLCGGTVYSAKPPEDRNYYLHWFYGTKREALPLEKRIINKNTPFKTSNFIIRSEILKKYPFDENIVTYGHEDTMFGIVLEENGIYIKHIDNPVLHVGLEPNDVFLNKITDSINTLWKIYNSYPNKELLLKKVRLLNKYHNISRWGGNYLFAMLYKIARKPLSNRILNNFSLFLLDIYKLSYLCNISTL